MTVKKMPTKQPQRTVSLRVLSRPGVLKTGMQPFQAIRPWMRKS